MTITDIVALAKHSELSGVAIKNNIDAIVAFMNLGMIELHGRFPIKVNEHIITLADSADYYTMPDDFMYATDALMEAPEGSSDSAVKLEINNSDDPYSIFFVDWNTVQVPDIITSAYIAIIYTAKPITVTVAQAEDGVSTIDMPDSLVDCLLSYIGYRAHMGVKSDSQSENNAHWKRFELNCSKARELGVAFPSDGMGMGSRIFDRGFV